MRTLALKASSTGPVSAVFRASNGQQMPSGILLAFRGRALQPSNDPDLTTSSLASISTENAPPRSAEVNVTTSQRAIDFASALVRRCSG